MYFSIVIPTFNRLQELETCLASLSRIDYPKSEFEVIVVDDGSAIPVLDVLHKYSNVLPVHSFRQENAGTAAARNTGAAKAVGQYIIFIDDDCSLEKSYLNKLADVIEANQGSMIGGRVVNALSDNIYSEASQILVDYLCKYFNKNADKPSLFTGSNIVVPNKYFNSGNGFDTSFSLGAGEDREICDRWYHQGRSLIYAPELLVYHSHRLNFRSFWRQHFNYGQGSAHYHKIRCSRKQGYTTPEPLSFYLNLVTYPLTQALGWRTMPMLILFVVAQIATICGTYRMSWTRN